MKQILFVFTILITCNAIAQPAWQQRVDTKIDVRLDDRGNFLNAYEEFTYTNNSPDTLKFLYVELYANGYKNDRTKFARQMDLNGNTSFYYAKPKDRGYIDSLQFTEDGQSVEYYCADNEPDIARIELLKPILPGKQVKIATPFRVKIPIVFSRMGHTGQAYFISQWFPKPSVYDQKGWHPLPYLDQGEFFSEYGSYDVNISLPANYVLMATGNCMDEKENKWMDELSKKEMPMDTLYNDGWPSSDLENKTVHYHEDNVHDFAWFADKRWVVRKDTVTSPGNNQLVTTWAAFLPSYQNEWKHACDYMKETVRHYGKWVGPYQYKTVKAVLGDMPAGAGMEYPTITIVDKTAKSGLQTVIVHEVGHNWFYGMLGSNERDHAWMDEGINTFYEQKTDRDIAHDTSELLKPGPDETMFYFEQAMTHTDQAIDQASANFTKTGYGVDVYYKTALMLRWLERYMGAEDFEAGMHDYYNTWHYHHPYPEDVRACLQRHTNKPIGWFFDTILHNDKRIDFTIIDAAVNGNNTDVTIRNNSGVTSPVLIDEMIGDSIVAKAWSAPFDSVTTITIPGTVWNKMEVDDIVPDAKQANNEYRRNALFHRFGVGLGAYLGLNESKKDKVFIMPYFGYNQYDGIMPVIVIHDITVPENRFRFILAPMYSAETKSFTGAGSVGYVWYPDNLFKEIMVQADAKTFHYNETLINLKSPMYARYAKFAPSLLFTFNQHDPLSPVTQTLLLKGYSITEQNFDFGADSVGAPTLKAQQKMYGLLRFKHQNKQTYNPFDYDLEGQIGADFAKINVEANKRIDYNRKNKSLYIRAYFGKFFPISGDGSVTSRYELNSSYSGVDDYLYDGYYLGRNAQSRLASQQISMQEGGFKVPVFNNVDQSNNWMITTNLKTDLPLGKVPLRLFFDAGLIPNETPSMTNSSSTTLLYDGGVEVYVLKDVISIYYPIIMSSDFQNYLLNSFGRREFFSRSLSFTFQLQNINWLKAPPTILKMVTN